MDWIGFRLPFSDSVHDSCVLGGRSCDGRLGWRGWVVEILRFYGGVMVGGQVRSGAGVDWFRSRRVFSDSVQEFGRPPKISFSCPSSPRGHVQYTVRIEDKTVRNRDRTVQVKLGERWR